MSSENMVLVRLLQVGAKDLTVPGLLNMRKVRKNMVYLQLYFLYEVLDRLH